VYHFVGRTVKIKSSLQKKIRAKKGEELIHIVCSDFQDTIGIAEAKPFSLSMFIFLCKGNMLNFQETFQVYINYCYILAVSIFF